MPETTGEVTQLLTDLRQGDAHAADRLLPLVYAELRRLAGKYMRGERPDHTLQPTALVNEAYLQMMGGRAGDWQSRAHFIGVAARTMRHLLVDHARAQRAQKRGDGVEAVPLTERLAVSTDRDVDVIELNDALERLAARDPRQAQIVEMRFFGGLSNEEIGEILQVSPRTVIREWNIARAWLFGQLQN